MDGYIPELKYPIGTKVYVCSGNSTLLKGRVINHKIKGKDGHYIGSCRVYENIYLVKFLENFKDGLEHGNWFSEDDLSLYKED